MKTILLLAMFVLILFGCGPSAEEKRQQQIKDSIEAEADRNKAIEEVELFLNATSDSTEQQAQ